MTHDSVLLAILKRIYSSVLKQELSDIVASSKKAFWVLKAIFVLSQHTLHYFNDVCLCIFSASADLRKLQDYFLLFLDVSQGKDLPKLWNPIDEQPAKVKVKTTCLWSAFAILFNELFNFHGNIICSVQNLSDYWKHDELHAVFSGVVLEHVHCGHHRALHWRSENYFPVYLVDYLLVVLCLHDADLMKLGINQVSGRLNCSELFRIFPELGFSNKGFVVEFRQSVSNENEVICFKIFLLHGWSHELDAILNQLRVNVIH